MTGEPTYLLEQGVTLPPPPPDPADVVVKALRSAAADDDRLVLAYAVRDLFPAGALKAAAAKIAPPNPLDELIAAALAWAEVYGDGWRGPEGDGTSGNDVLRRLAAAAAKVQEAET